MQLVAAEMYLLLLLSLSLPAAHLPKNLLISLQIRKKASPLKKKIISPLLMKKYTVYSRSKRLMQLVRRM